MGLNAGLPDLFLIINNKALFIEMKRIKKSVTSEFQKDWIEAINKCNGVNAYICYGFEEAKELVDRLLNTKAKSNKELLTPYKVWPTT